MVVSIGGSEVILVGVGWDNLSLMINWKSRGRWVWEVGKDIIKGWGFFLSVMGSYWRVWRNE